MRVTIIYFDNLAYFDISKERNNNCITNYLYLNIRHADFLMCKIVRLFNDVITWHKETCLK